MPGFLAFGFVIKIAIAVVVLVGGLATVLGVLGARKEKAQGVKGGSGKVVGVVGRMGSGKSYFAVRMAHARLMSGANVCTNFTMKLPEHLQNNWTQFHGWDDFATLENSIVIIDEAQLYAPSNKTISFPTVARWKLAQARKFGLDVYWISQHENRVNSILRDLTHMVYVCRSFNLPFAGKTFEAKGYEPETMRVVGKHIDSRRYKFKLDVADLYDTLQILDADEHLVKGDDSMRKAAAIGQRYNARRGTGTAGTGGFPGGGMRATQ